MGVAESESPNTRDTSAKTHRPTHLGLGHQTYGGTKTHRRQNTGHAGQDTSADTPRTRPPNTRGTKTHRKAVPKNTGHAGQATSADPPRSAHSSPPRLTFSSFLKKHETPRMWRVIETTSDSSSSTQTRPGLGWQPPMVGCARAPSWGGGHDTPGQGAHAHPAPASSCGGGHNDTPGQGARAHPASASSCGGGVTTHLAKVHVHTLPRP